MQEIMPASLTQHNTSEAIDWVIMSVGKINLIIALDKVAKITHINKSVTFLHEGGFLMAENIDTPHVALDEHLKPLSFMPDQRFISTTIAMSTGDMFTWCWEKVVSVRKQIDFTKIPAKLVLENSPITQYADIEVNEEAMLVYQVDLDALFLYAFDFT